MPPAAQTAAQLTSGRVVLWLQSRRSSGMRRRRSSNMPAGTLIGGSMSDHEEVHSRLQIIDDTLRTCDAEIRSIQEHLQLLPQLCELLNLPVADGAFAPAPADVTAS